MNAGKHVILITNVPKPRGPPANSIALRCCATPGDAIVTSGDAIREEICARAGGRCSNWADDYDRSLWEGLGLALALLSDVAFFAISGLNRDDETPADAGYLGEAKARNLISICANPGHCRATRQRTIWCAGAIARDYEAIMAT